MQNAEQIATAAASSQLNTVQKGDQLVIFVTAKNMEVVKPFNQAYYSSQNSISTTPSSSNSTEKTYLVNSEGDIDFPILGTINTTNKTLEEVKNDLTQRITAYVKNPTVTVRLANFKVTVLGEVTRPGQYSLPEVNPTLLSAIGIAGDLTMYGKREDVLIVRNVDGQPTKERVNLLDANFVNSPYFYLKQGDVIYVSSNETKAKIARQDPNTSIYLAVAGTLIGLAGIFITIFKK
ncbi:polysaccharide biosynthesis/export family protein [Kaistella treverensis]|nr:polysaccharide biosynthesis/export family protein [Kaistella treverensis]